MPGSDRRVMEQQTEVGSTDFLNCRHSMPTHQVHVWFTPVPKMGDAGFFSRCFALMSPQEFDRHSRLVFERDKRRNAVTRALVRIVLSRYTGIRPERLAFTENAYGRPEIAVANHQQACGLHFNISHASNLVVLAVARHRELGIDIESSERQVPPQLADTYFSALEAADLRALPLDEQPRRFWELWTFKESYIKARGMGLSLSLNKFSFGLHHSKIVAFSCDENLDVSPTRWMFCQLQLDHEHLVALCVERSAAECIEIVCRYIDPLGGGELAWDALLTRLSIDADACRVISRP